MADTNPYPRSMWIKEIPFDVAEWGDKELLRPDGTFKTKAEFEAALARARKNLPVAPVMPKRE